VLFQRTAEALIHATQVAADLGRLGVQRGYMESKLDRFLPQLSDLSAPINRVLPVAAHDLPATFPN
jgi:hypothetical protein